VLTRALRERSGRPRCSTRRCSARSGRTCAGTRSRGAPTRASRTAGRGRWCAAAGERRESTAPTSWAGKAQEILRCYLLAAALAGADMTRVMHWANDPDDPEPAAILDAHRHLTPHGWLPTLLTHLRASPNTRTGYFATVTSCVGFMDSPTVAEACRPGPGGAFNVEAFLRWRGTLYLVGGAGDKRLAPLLTALTEYVFDEAQRIAAAQPGGRLTPTLNFVLDEVANITPVPLDRWASDSRGWGITVGAVVQSLAQFATTWGRDRAEVIWENLPARSMLPGVTNSEDLRALSYLAGQRWCSAPPAASGAPTDAPRAQPPTRPPSNPWWPGTISSMPLAPRPGPGPAPGDRVYTPATSGGRRAGAIAPIEPAAAASRRRTRRQEARSCNCPRPAGGPDDRADPAPTPFRRPPLARACPRNAACRRRRRRRPCRLGQRAAAGTGCCPSWPAAAPPGSTAATSPSCAPTSPSLSTVVGDNADHARTGHPQVRDLDGGAGRPPANASTPSPPPSPPALTSGTGAGSRQAERGAGGLAIAVGRRRHRRMAGLGDWVASVLGRSGTHPRAAARLLAPAPPCGARAECGCATCVAAHPPPDAAPSAAARTAHTRWRREALASIAAAIPRRGVAPASTGSNASHAGPARLPSSHGPGPGAGHVPGQRPDLSAADRAG
jgi:hypothetical protein